MALNPVDIIAGLVIMGAGILTIFGYVDLAVVISGIGLLIEGIKIAVQQGLR